MPDTVFISDLHLQQSKPELTQLAFALFDKISCEQLYILGDLFEYWIGDDHVDDTAKAVYDKLSALHKRGTKINVMHGNRDFLLGPQYVEGFGGTLITDDTTCIDVAATQTLLMHGDTLCTDDTNYQFYRRMVRNNAWQQDFLSKKVSERQATVRMIRDTSKVRGEQAHREKIADINDNTFAETINTHKVTTVIHGHTHRPAEHSVTVGTQKVRRLVLGEWSANGAVIAVGDADNCDLVTWDGSSLSAFT